MSLCFRDAFLSLRRNSITDTEYLSSLLAHFRGVRHPQDSEYDVIVPKFDPFGASIRDLALKTDYEPLESDSLPSLIQPIATLSAIRGHASILQFCLDNGAAFDDYLNGAAEMGSSKYPEVLEVLKAAGWKSKLQVTEEDEAKEGERGPDGRFTPAELQRRFGDIPW
ncbi:MAG: hypothetical protein M1839_005524 [Geoglossum umbratile]|nr:MAG: hypothetical protein M1839_005524 [Geoglossum umbratile]